MMATWPTGTGASPKGLCSALFPPLFCEFEMKINRQFLFRTRNQHWLDRHLPSPETSSGIPLSFQSVVRFLGLGRQLNGVAEVRVSAL